MQSKEMRKIQRELEEMRHALTAKQTAVGRLRKSLNKSAFAKATTLMNQCPFLDAGSVLFNGRCLPKPPLLQLHLPCPLKSRVSTLWDIRALQGTTTEVDPRAML